MTDLAVLDRAEPDVLRLAGEIDMSNSATVERVVRQALESSVQGVVLDLSDTSYLDSAGIRMVFLSARTARAANKRLVLLVPAGSPLRRVLEIAEVPAVVPVHDEREAARVALAA
jgi:stage II sporulation protein AA (anti-sigma F factor antagonist)